MISVERLRLPTADERALLLATLGLAPTVEVAASPIDWPFIVAYARAHLVLPAFGRQLLASRRREEIPPTVREALADAALHNEVQNRVLLFDFAEAVRTLEGAGIPSIAIKGAALMAQFPTLAISRHTDDIDLWVDPSRVFDADRILRSVGYSEVAHSPSPLPQHDGSATSTNSGSPHHLRVLTSPRGTPFEIHRYPPSSTKTERLDFRGALDDAVRVELHGVRVTVRDAQSTLRDLSGHVAVTHCAMPTLWPRHLLDVATLLDGRDELLSDAIEDSKGLNRFALILTRHVRTQAQRPKGGFLARRFVFPAAHVGWGWDRILFQATGYLRQGPAPFARALWPSAAFLRAKGFDPNRGRLRANLARVRALLSPPETS